MKLPSAAQQIGHERIARLVLGGLTLAVAAWLGYALGRGQSLADVARLYRDQAQLTFTIDTGAMTVQLSRTGGDAKPVFKAPDGTSLMDYSDWDYSGVVVADGQRFELVRLIQTSEADYARARLVQGLDSGDWGLSREVTVSGAQADVRFRFIARKPVHQVEFVIPHASWYFLQVTPRPDGFSATVPHALPQEVESGQIRSPSYESDLKVTSEHAAAAGLVQVALSRPFGVQTVTTRYELHDPPVGDYVELATEHLSWRKL